MKGFAFWSSGFAAGIGLVLLLEGQAEGVMVLLCSLMSLGVGLNRNSPPRKIGSTE